MQACWYFYYFRYCDEELVHMLKFLYVQVSCKLKPKVPDKCFS